MNKMLTMADLRGPLLNGRQLVLDLGQLLLRVASVSRALASIQGQKLNSKNTRSTQSQLEATLKPYPL
jgi:hypothetical protein